MKRKVTGASFIIALLLSATGLTLVNLATANPIMYLPIIEIKSDGSVEPQTEYIRQDGNVYTLTADLPQKYAIKIQCSNIVFDGAGHTISGPGYSNKGLDVESVTNVTVKDVEVRGFWIADVYIESITRSVFLHVKASSFHLQNSDLNTIAESNIGYDSRNLFMGDSNNNTFVRNNFNNIIQGDAGNSNIFFENNFWKQPSFSVNEANFWDNGSVGNYWSGYEGVDGNGDGIGDTPYVINAEAQDRFPLMNPWDPEIPYDTVPPRISVISPVHRVYNDSSVPLSFVIYESLSSMSYSLDGQDNVTITGNSTISGLTNGFHNITVYARDEFENVGTSETISFNVHVPFPTVLVAAASIVTVVVVGVGLLVYFKKRKR